MNEYEMDEFINKKKGSEGTYSSLIAEIAKKEKNEKFEQYIIVTDRMVFQGEIDKCDDLVKKYNLKFSYVSIYIIGNGGNESIGCPFLRDSIGITYKIDDNGKEEILASVSLDDKKALKHIKYINSWNEFDIKYNNLFNSIRDECLGKEQNENLKNKLNALKNRINIPDSKRKILI